MNPTTPTDPENEKLLQAKTEAERARGELMESVNALEEKFEHIGDVPRSLKPLALGAVVLLGTVFLIRYWNKRAGTPVITRLVNRRT